MPGGKPRGERAAARPAWPRRVSQDLPQLLQPPGANNSPLPTLQPLESRRETFSHPHRWLFHQIPATRAPASAMKDICRRTRAFRSWFGRRKQGHSSIAWQQISFPKKKKNNKPTPRPSLLCNSVERAAGNALETLPGRSGRRELCGAEIWGRWGLVPGKPGLLRQEVAPEASHWCEEWAKAPRASP